MTHTLFEIKETGEMLLWKDCKISGCQNQVCKRLSDKYCYPHSRTGKMLNEIKDSVVGAKNKKLEKSEH